MQKYNSQTLSSSSESALATNKVLRNTYTLLAMTLAFSALVAGITAKLGLGMPNIFVFLIGAYGLMFLTQKFKNSSMGLLFVFMFTGFMGYTIGPLIAMYVGAGAGDLVAMALGGTALTFFALSAYVLTTNKDMSFLGGMMTAGFVVLIVSMIANLFLNIPVFGLVISAMFILFSSGAILMQTSAIIRGGESSYISATVTLFVSLYNIFVSLLSLLGGSRD